MPTLRAAKELDLQLKLRRSMGELHVEKATTLGDEIDALLKRLRASSLSPSTIEFYERSAKIWEPFRSKHVTALRQPKSRTSSSVGRQSMGGQRRTNWSS